VKKIPLNRALSVSKTIRPQARHLLGILLFATNRNRTDFTTKSTKGHEGWHSSKCVEEIKGIHETQLLTYMKLAGFKRFVLRHLRALRGEKDAECDQRHAGGRPCLAPVNTAIMYSPIA
jgi:hypothetical protein